MTTAQALLGLLERRPAHGYTLKHDFDACFGHAKPLAFGQVYSSLARFERKGWAEVVDVETGSGPERKRYRITADGVGEVHSWVVTPQDPGACGASSLYARVAVALLSGRDAQQVLEAQRRHHLELMRDLTARRRGADAALKLALTYELAHLDADLRWIEESGQRLGELRDALGEAR